MQLTAIHLVLGSLRYSKPVTVAKLPHKFGVHCHKTFRAETRCFETSESRPRRFGIINACVNVYLPESSPDPTLHDMNATTYICLILYDNA